jgi:hypothetical protein
MERIQNSLRGTCKQIYFQIFLYEVINCCCRVIILPTGVSGEDAKHLPLHKHWVAKVKEVRANANTTDVSVLIPHTSKTHNNSRSGPEFSGIVMGMTSTNL